MNLQAIIFDLDGVITATSEYHYLAWKRLADEEGMPFDRQINERLRGVARRASLQIILDGASRTASEAEIADMMARKNSYYVALLEQVSPANLLPGALDLLKELRAAGVKISLGSASKNAPTVLKRLGIAGLFDVIADGHSVSRQKPAPDLFLWAAEQLDVDPAACAVVEDAAAGVDAALAAGMWAVGIGPGQRVGHAHARFEGLAGVSLAQISEALESSASTWTVAEDSFDPAGQPHKETVFTTGNGYLSLRGSLEEGHPGDQPACFVHRLWDDMPVNFSELANIPRWWSVAVWLDGRRFRLDLGRVLAYRRALDLRTGVLRRRVRWQAEAGGPVIELRFERLASLARPHLALLRVQAKLVEGAEAELRLRWSLNAHVENTGLLHWRLVDQGQTPDSAHLHVRSRSAGIDLALAGAVGVEATGASEAPVAWKAAACDADGQPGVERRASLHAGEGLALEAFVGIVSSNEAGKPLESAAALAQSAKGTGYRALRAENDALWAETWTASDVLIEGDREAQLALRFNIFQLLIAAPRHTERASIGAKTLSGFGYRHHVFWDTEIFMLPLFSFTQPELARNMLMYRWHNLPGARAKAAANGFEGAQFPWESAGDGLEVTPTWVPHYADRTRLIRIWTGDIEIHITADIAYAVMQFWRVTGDDAWMRDVGAELLLDGARFYASAARLEADGRYHYRNVVGPDEYHDRINDNAFTNELARWHLETALAVLAWLKRAYPARHAELSAALDLNAGRLAHWAAVIDGMYLPKDPESGLIEQFSGYFELEEPDFALLRDPQRSQSMQALLNIEGCAATQIIKQPDVLMLQYLLPERFSREQVQVNYDYYDPRTDHEHGSSLGPSISAIMACRMGLAEAAYEHFMRAARADLHDVRHNAGEGIHGASAGGLWQAAIFGFAGLRLDDDGWQTEPQLPAHWTRLAFKFYHRGELQVVDIRR